MTAQSQLEAYLGEFRRRLIALIVARGAALAGRGRAPDHARRGLPRHPPRVRPRSSSTAPARCSRFCSARIVVALLVLPLRALKRTPRHPRHRAARARFQRPAGDLRRPHARQSPAHAVPGPARRGRAESRAQDPGRAQGPAAQIRVPAAILRCSRPARSSGSRLSAPPIGATASATCGPAGCSGHVAAAAHRGRARRRHGAARRRLHVFADARTASSRRACRSSRSSRPAASGKARR